MEAIRDSIFISSFRALCKSIGVIFGIFLALIPIFFFFSLFSKGGDISPTTTLTFLPDANGSREIQAISTPVILQLTLHGIIGEGDLTGQVVNNQLIDSRSGLLKPDRVKALLLNLQTPGGTVMDSDTIYRLLLAYKEKYHVPIYAYVDGLCASGGMYIACAADKINAAPSSIVGSVGVVAGPFFNLKEAMTKLGINAETITQGKNKDSLNPFRTWKPDEDGVIKAITTYFYNQFLTIVTSARPQVTKEQLLQEYGAAIFDPIKAQEIGYIDNGNSSYLNTLKELLAAVDISEDTPYQVVELQPRKSWLETITSPDANSALSSLLQLLGFPKKSSVDSYFSYLYAPG